MKSFRAYSFILFIFSFLVLLSAMFLTKSIVKPIFHNTYDFREHILEYEVLIGESKLPLAVLDNISDQFSVTKVADPERYRRLNGAYDSNIKILKRNLEVTESHIDTLNMIIEESGKYPFIAQIKEYDYTKAQVEMLKNRINTIEQAVDQLNFESIGNQNGDIEKIKEELTDFEYVTKQLLKKMAVWSKMLVDAFMKLNSYIYLILICVSAILGGFLLRVLGKNTTFILESFTKLNRFETDSNETLNFKPFFSEEELLYNNIKEVFKEQRFLNDLKASSNQFYILDDFLDQLFEKIQTVLKVDRLGVSFVHNDGNHLVAEYGICNYPEVYLKPGYEIELAKSSLRDVIVDQKSYFDNDVFSTYSDKSSSNSLKLIVKENIRSHMVVPLMINDSVFGILFFSSREKGSYDEAALQIGKNISHELSAVIHKTYFTKKMLAMVTQTFARLVEERDLETGDHIGRMTEYALLIAEELVGHTDSNYVVNASFMKDMRIDAPIHDIGKVGIPDEILKKPGRLKADEFEIMKTHAKIGGDILQSMQNDLKHFNTDFYKNAREIVLYHHEKWDGTGYPEGLREFEIPLAARIVAIADVFDALVSKRVYKEPIDFELAIQMINESKGSHFDPYLVDIFLSKKDKILTIYKDQQFL